MYTYNAEEDKWSDAKSISGKKKVLDCSLSHDYVHTCTLSLRPNYDIQPYNHSLYLDINLVHVDLLDLFRTGFKLFLHTILQ